MNNELRRLGIDILSIYMKYEQNIKIVEQLICAVGGDYTRVLYETIGLFQMDYSIKDICCILHKKQIGLDGKIFDKCKIKQSELDFLQENPVEVTGGISVCKKCNSDKVLSYQKQTRKADETSTTFNICVTCGCKWKYSG